MRYLGLIVIGAVASLNVPSVLAECNNSGYGSTNCDNKDKDYIVEKKVKRSDDSSKEEKITNVRKGDTFVFTFKITNKTDKEVNLKLTDNLPNEFERVSGIGFTEDIKISKDSSKTLEMVAKVKDSEFEGKKDFEKCVVNKAYIEKDDKKKDSSTATVCFGDGAKISSLPKTGASSLVTIGALFLTTLFGLGFALNKIRS